MEVGCNDGRVRGKSRTARKKAVAAKKSSRHNFVSSSTSWRGHVTGPLLGGGELSGRFAI
jgi:hypothetical protein